MSANASLGAELLLGSHFLSSHSVNSMLVTVDFMLESIFAIESSPLTNSM